MSPRAAVLLALATVAFVAAHPLGAQDVDGGARPLVPVASRRLPRGTVLNESDIAVARVASRGPADSVASAVRAGWITRRLVRAGEPLRPPAVVPPALIAAGAPVAFVMQRDGFALSVDGIAVVAASLGDTIPVRLGAKRRVVGTVTGPARVVALDPQRIP